jgi:hypothetical protein
LRGSQVGSQQPQTHSPARRCLATVAAVQGVNRIRACRQSHAVADAQPFPAWQALADYSPAGLILRIHGHNPSEIRGRPRHVSRGASSFDSGEASRARPVCCRCAGSYKTHFNQARMRQAVLRDGRLARPAAWMCSCAERPPGNAVAASARRAAALRADCCAPPGGVACPSPGSRPLAAIYRLGEDMVALAAAACPVHAAGRAFPACPGHSEGRGWVSLFLGCVPVA